MITLDNLTNLFKYLCYFIKTCHQFIIHSNHSNNINI